MITLQRTPNLAALVGTLALCLHPPVTAQSTGVGAGVDPPLFAGEVAVL
jgi:hypothetical protein